MNDAPLHTPICDFFDIRHPVVLAGMGEVSTPALTAAVSNAGGLGVLGGAALPPDELAGWIEETRRLTDRPFGVDTLLPARHAGSGLGGEQVDWSIPASHAAFVERFMEAHGLEPTEAVPPLFTPDFFERQVEVVLDLRVPVYVSGLGSPGRFAERARQLGIKVGCVVGATRHAHKVLADGVDFVVAQGHDGGGHNSRVGTFALIPQVVDAVGGEVPVLGAGAIMDGRGLVAALALGAQGVWCGSAFLATDEAGLTPAQKQAVVDHGDRDTVVSRTRTGKPARMIKNAWVEAFEASGLEPLPMPLQGLLAYGVMAAADAAGRADVNPGFAGQGIGLVHGVRPAADVLHEMVETAADLLTTRFGHLTTA